MEGHVGLELLKEGAGTGGAHGGINPQKGHPEKAVYGREAVVLLPPETQVLGVYLDQTSGKGLHHPPLRPQARFPPPSRPAFSRYPLMVESLALEDPSHAGGREVDAVILSGDHRHLVLGEGGMLSSLVADELHRLPGDAGGPSPFRGAGEVLKPLGSLLEAPLQPLVEGGSGDAEPTAGHAHVFTLLVVPDHGEPF